MKVNWIVWFNQAELNAVLRHCATILLKVWSTLCSVDISDSFFFLNLIHSQKSISVKVTSGHCTGNNLEKVSSSLWERSWCGDAACVSLVLWSNIKLLTNTMVFKMNLICVFVCLCECCTSCSQGRRAGCRGPSRICEDKEEENLWSKIWTDG